MKDVSPEKLDEVATGSYNLLMSSEIKSVGIKELKNNLSQYVKEVKNGTRVLICDRNKVVAQISKVTADDISVPEREDARLTELAEQGLITLPKGKKKNLAEYGDTGINLPDGTAEKLLEFMREDKLKW